MNERLSPEPTPLQRLLAAQLDLFEAAKSYDARTYAVFLEITVTRTAREIAEGWRWEERPS
jgi:hypothetical protein